MSWLFASSNISSYVFEFIIYAIDFIVAKEESIYYILDWYLNNSNISIYILRFPVCVANFNIIENKKSSYYYVDFLLSHLRLQAIYLSILQLLYSFYLLFNTLANAFYGDGYIIKDADVQTLRYSNNIRNSNIRSTSKFVLLLKSQV